MDNDNRRMALDLAVKWHQASTNVTDDAVLMTAEKMRQFLDGETSSKS